MYGSSVRAPFVVASLAAVALACGAAPPPPNAPVGFRCPTTSKGDACGGDADCPRGQLCACGAAERSRCVPGNCHTDRDCGGAACGASRATFLGADYVRGVEGRWCRTKDDTCRTDLECDPAGRRACAYRGELGHWTCVDLAYGGG